MVEYSVKYYLKQVTASALHILMKQAYQKSGCEKTFDDWKNDCEQIRPQFKFWSIALRLELLTLSFVRSIRTADFALYKQSIKDLLPWFFALDHTHYSRWLSVHLADMLHLAETNPDIFDYFNKGMFVINKTKRKFSSIGIDHAHEQNNKCVKGDGGIFIFPFFYCKAAKKLLL